MFENKYPLFWYKFERSSPSGLVLSEILFFNKTPLYVSPLKSPKALASCASD